MLFFFLFKVIFLFGYADKTKVLFQKKGNTAGRVSGIFKTSLEIVCHYLLGI
jgi:hypothetical protein